MGNITKKQASEAYNTISDYCKGQCSCDDCIFSGSNGMFDLNCCIITSITPENWHTFETE